MRLYKVFVDKEYNILSYSKMDEEVKINDAYDNCIVALGYYYSGSDYFKAYKKGEFVIDMDAIKTRRFWSYAYDCLYNSLTPHLRNNTIGTIL